MRFIFLLSGEFTPSPQSQKPKRQAIQSSVGRPKKLNYYSEGVTWTNGGGLCYWKGKMTGSGSNGNRRGPERKLTFEEESDKAECYEAFKNLRVVLDCTELMTQRSSNLEARKKTFSNYKHYDSAKFLVGISPNLTVNFVSKAWGGRASDKLITLKSSSLMESLEDGDAVMADRGFNVAADFKKKGVQLLIPDFKGRDRAQISQKEASRSEYISKARIHVERVIQRIKTFYFLERTVRLNMHDIIEQVFTVCAYLTNFQMPVVRK